MADDSDPVYNPVRSSLLLACKCARGTKCPTIAQLSDGSFVLSDDAEGCKPIPLDDDQARALYAFLGGAIYPHRAAAE